MKSYSILRILFITGGITLLWVSLLSQAHCQPLSDSLSLSINYILNTIDEDTEGASDAIDSAIELLTYYLDHPINLNTCSFSDLAALPLLDGFTAKSIIKHRIKTGRFTSLSDLLPINTISHQFIQVLKPFVVIRDTSSALGLSTTEDNNSFTSNTPTIVFSQSIKRQIEQAKGYTIPSSEGGFKGNPNALFTRIVVDSPKGISGRLVLEKDPGEAITWAPEKRMYGADHIETTLSLRPKFSI